MSHLDGECGCDQCNNDDDPYACEHKEECCCEECHLFFHSESKYWADICDACFTLIELEQKEAENGDGEQQKS